MERWIAAVESNKDFQLKEGLHALKCIPVEQDMKYQTIIAEMRVFYMLSDSAFSARGDYKFPVRQKDRRLVKAFVAEADIFLITKTCF